MFSETSIVFFAIGMTETIFKTSNFQKKGKNKEALPYFDKAVQIDPTDPLCYSNRAYSKYKLGAHLAALADINLSIKLYPTNSYAFRNRALIYQALKEDKKACEDIDQALALGFTKMYGEEVEELKKKYCDNKIQSLSN